MCLTLNLWILMQCNWVVEESAHYYVVLSRAWSGWEPAGTLFVSWRGNRGTSSPKDIHGTKGESLFWDVELLACARISLSKFPSIKWHTINLHSFPPPQSWVCKFEKPKTSPTSLQPSTTVLSPYLKFGCLSPRIMYHQLIQVTQCSCLNISCGL